MSCKIQTYIIITLLILILKCADLKKRMEPPKVQLKNGMTVIGTATKTVDEKKWYYAFRGIPYAQPPLGDLRFKAPLPLPRNLSGHTIFATRDGPVCVQLILVMEGSEDCLYINVYTPQFNKSPELRPVMVWIYGGFFFAGDSTYESYGPDYLLNDDVIVVTFNYRMGIFGFLSTEDEVSPGNYGLKDQVLALQWVHENIISFGGNKEKVTIFSESSGSCCAAYLSQTSITKGLFHGVILQSATSLSTWALIREPTKITTAIATNLNVDTSSHQSMVDGLRQIDFRKLAEVQLQVGLENVLLNNFLNSLPFGPTLEPPSSEAIVTKLSYEELKKGSFHHTPYLMGFNSEEGLVFDVALTLLRGYLLRYDLLPTELVPLSLNLTNESTKKVVNNVIASRYFGMKPVLFSKDKFVKFVSDDMFNRPITETALLYSKHSPVYFYQFSYQGPSGSGPGYKRQNGVAHAADLYYLWRISSLGIANKFDKRTQKRMVRLWTNFAKTCNPTPQRDPLLQNIVWPVANVNQTFNLRYLDINKKLTTMVNPKWDSFLFWTDMFNTYGNPPYSTY